VAVLRALLLVAVDPVLGRVDVDEREGLRAGQQRGRLAQAGQELAVGLLQLADVSPGERPQERAEGGRGADPAEDFPHRAVAEQVHVVDRVRAGGHPGRQAGDLQGRVRGGGAGGAHAGGQFMQSGALGEGQERHEAGVGDEVRVVESHARFRERMQQLHLEGVLSALVTVASQLPSSQARGHFFIKTPANSGHSPVDPGSALHTRTAVTRKALPIAFP
jgi:hypothetical protein